MNAYNLTITQTDSYMQMACLVQGADSGPAEELWFRINPAPGHQNPCPGDPLVAVLLLPSMLTGQDLQIDAPVSRRLMDAVSLMQDIYKSWFPRATRVSIKPKAIEDIQSQIPRGCASFFSGGVDSFYTLHKHKDKLTHLILVHGFDIRLDDQWQYAQAVAHIHKVAIECGKSLIQVATNIRTFIDRFVRWDYSHGAALASVALACSGSVEHVYIASTYPYRRLVTWGSHPLLDPLWSNGLVRITHDGCEADRLEKVQAAICNWQLALDTLRVCWKHLDGKYNCGRCEKCIRTMLCLHACGALGRSATFPKRIPLLRLATRDFQTWYPLVLEILEKLPPRGLYNKLVVLSLQIAILRSKLHRAWRIIFPYKDRMLPPH